MDESIIHSSPITTIQSFWLQRVEGLGSSKRDPIQNPLIHMQNQRPLGLRYHAPGQQENSCLSADVHSRTKLCNLHSSEDMFLFLNSPMIVSFWKQARISRLWHTHTNISVISLSISYVISLSYWTYLTCLRGTPLSLASLVVTSRCCTFQAPVTKFTRNF